MPGGVGQLADGMRGLYAGWREYSDGISKLYDGTQQFYNETTGLPDDIDELLDGIEEIKIHRSKTVSIQQESDDNKTFFQRVLSWFKK